MRIRRLNGSQATQSKDVFRGSLAVGKATACLWLCWKPPLSLCELLTSAAAGHTFLSGVQRAAPTSPSSGTPDTCYFKENKRGLLLIRQHCLRLFAVSSSCNSVCSRTALLELYRITQREWWEVAADALEGIVPTTKDHQEASGGCGPVALAGSPHGAPSPS